ncbi:hypothetical protein V6N13_032402 [Hibiscus sabdariffa]|uniref:Uncharacterized protein n=1 Tax=Hibiscus sabdariffa TaxID=183260 RepID=A0ABR2C194_9ROSI
MIAKCSTSGAETQISGDTAQEKVVVLEDDVVIEPWHRNFSTTEKHPSQETCAMHSPHSSSADIYDSRSVPSKPMPTQGPTTTTHYGPWMVVDTRRRRSLRKVNELSISSNNASPANMVNGTRFSVLPDSGDYGASGSNSQVPAVVEKAHVSLSVGKENSGLPLNAAYLASNPGKKKKSASKVALTPEVVSLVEGEDVEVVPHIVKQQPEKHTAVALVDRVSRKAGMVGGKVAKQRGVTGRSLPDARRGVPLRKPAEVHLSTANNVSTWVQDLAQQLSTVKKAEGDGFVSSGSVPESSMHEGSLTDSGTALGDVNGQVPVVTDGDETVPVIMDQ